MRNGISLLALVCALLLAAPPWRLCLAAAQSPGLGCRLPSSPAPGGAPALPCESDALAASLGVRLLYGVDTGSGLLHVALVTPARGWVSVAWTRPQDAGSMVPAHAYIGRLLDGGSGEVKSVALLPALYSGDAGAGIAPLDEGAAVPLDARVLRDSNGTTLRFSRRLGDAQSLPPRAVPVVVAAAGGPDAGGAASAPPNTLNWAYGTSDELGYHGPQHRGSFSQQFVPAAAAAAPAPPPATAPPAAAPPASQPAAAPQPRRRRRTSASPARLRTHGRLMLVAWAGLLPFGALLGRLVQHPRLVPHTLRAHIAVQVAGLAVATVSFALIVAALRQVMAFNDPVLIPYAHGKVGVSALCVLWAQPLNALLRPHPGVTRRRRAWEYAHALLGRAALVLGIVNMFTGIYILGRELRLVPFNTWACWSAVSLGCIWLLGAAIQKTLDQHGRMRAFKGEEVEPDKRPHEANAPQNAREP